MIRLKLCYRRPNVPASIDSHSSYQHTPTRTTGQTIKCRVWRSRLCISGQRTFTICSNVMQRTVRTRSNCSFIVGGRCRPGAATRTVQYCLHSSTVYCLLCLCEICRLWAVLSTQSGYPLTCCSLDTRNDRMGFWEWAKYRRPCGNLFRAVSSRLDTRTFQTLAYT